MPSGRHSRRSVVRSSALGLLAWAGMTRVPASVYGQADTPTATPSPPNLKLTNGQWFDGRSFVRTTMFTAGGVFREQTPATIDQTIDLGGNVVLPPIGDAHVHWLAGPGTATWFTSLIAAGLAVSEFYVLDLGGIPAFSPVLDPLVNQPTSVDFVISQQRWTGRHGWPEFVYTAAAKAGILALPVEQFEGGAYFQVESEADIARDWPPP